MQCKQSHKCFFCRQPSSFSMQQKCVCGLPRSSTQNIKKMSTRGSRFLKRSLFSVLCQGHSSVNYFWCKSVVAKNTTCGPKIAGTATFVCTEASEVLPMTAFTPSVQMSMQETWKYLLSVIMKRALISWTPERVVKMSRCPQLTLLCFKCPIVLNSLFSKINEEVTVLHTPHPSNCFLIFPYFRNSLG